MSVRYILDTDHVSLFQRSHAQVVARVLACPPASLAVTIITVEEQLQGRLAVLHQAKHEQEVARSYARLGEAVDFFHAIQVVPYTEVAAARFVALRRQGIRIGTLDLRIAAVVSTLQVILVTRNARDFAQVPGLVIEDWSIVT